MPSFEDSIPIAPAQPSPAAAAPVGIKAFTTIDGQLRMVDIQAIALVDISGRPFNVLSEETGQRIATAFETLANLIAQQGGQLPPF